MFYFHDDFLPIPIDDKITFPCFITTKSNLLELDLKLVEKTRRLVVTLYMNKIYHCKGIVTEGDLVNFNSKCEYNVVRNINDLKTIYLFSPINLDNLMDNINDMILNEHSLFLSLSSEAKKEQMEVFKKSLVIKSVAKSNTANNRGVF